MKKKIRYRIEYLLFRSFIFFVRISPLSIKSFFKQIALLFFKIAGGKYKKLVDSNLLIAFSNMSADSREKLKKRIFNHYATVLVDIVYLFSRKKAEFVIGELKIEGEENLKNALKRGKGAVLFSAHFGNWELIPFGLNRLLNLRVNSIARKMDNPLTEKIVKKFREHMGSEIIYKDGSLRKMLRILGENGLVYLLVDQNTITREGVPVTFFNREVIAVTTVAQLRIRKNVPVIPVFLTYEKEEKLLRIGKELKTDNSSSIEKNIRDLTQMTIEMIEEKIKERPEQWFWFHDRWRKKIRSDKE